MRLNLPAVAIVGTLLMAACAPATPPEPTPDINVIRTSAAHTVVAEFTLTATSWTPTPQPTFTPTPTLEQVIDTATATVQSVAIATNAEGTPVELCDKYSWDNATVDVNVPDNTEVTPGQEFVKTWKIANAGSCTWGAGYRIVYANYATQMSGQPQPLPSVVAPGEEIEISVQFRAPTQAGEYVSAWTLANAKGVPFFGNNNKPLYVKIIVK